MSSDKKKDWVTKAPDANRMKYLNLICKQIYVVRIGQNAQNKGVFRSFWRKFLEENLTISEH